MAVGKTSRGAGVSSLIRRAGQEAKQTLASKDAVLLDVQLESADGVSLGGTGSVTLPGPRIFSILDYIEQPWGLGMRLYPAQRFLVKLYYFLPLEDCEKTIAVTDMFNTKVLHRFTEKEYLKYLYDEGRCNIREQDHERRDLVLPIGRRAGKCLSKGSVVLTCDGFREIQELGDPDGPEYQTLSVTVAQEGARRAVSAFFYNGGERDTIRIRTRCGYEVEGTPNHRIRVMARGGAIQWRFLGDMQVGDRIGVHRRTDLWATGYVDVTPYLKELPGQPPRQLSAPSPPVEFDETWGALLGALVGGAWRSQPEAMQPEWLEQVREMFRATVGEPVVRLGQHPQGVRCVQLDSAAVCVFLDRLGYGSGAGVPWVIRRSPKPVVAAFLRGLFETGGCGRHAISISTVSAKLASDVQLLLLNFGIVSKVKPRLGKTCYRLTIFGADSVRTFAEQIGVLSEHRMALLRARTSEGALGKSGAESIPHQRDWCRVLLESVPKSAEGWQRALLRTALGGTLKNAGEELSYPRLRAALAVAREVGADPQILAHFEEILSAGYFFDGVVEVSQGRGHVYDLTVPDGASFVASGVVNHNTTLSAIFASYEVYRLLNLHHPQAYYGLPSGNRIQIISIATDKDQAAILYNDVTTHLVRCEYFKPYVANNTLSYVQFRTPYDIDRYGTTVRVQDGRFVSLNGKATLKLTFKSCIAKGLRGSGNAVVILDEMAHFQDKGQSSAKDIYDAVTPSTAAFSPKNPKSGMPIGPTEARVICISSPLGRSGKFFELYDLAMRGGPGSENLLAVQAPTWEVNPTVPTSYYKRKYHEDPTVFMVEHGAQFSDQVRGWIEREQDLLACVDPELRPIESGWPRSPYQCGIDVGLVGDGTFVAITHIEGDRIILDYHEGWYAGVDWRDTNPHLIQPLTEYARNLTHVKRLDFDAIADWIIELTRRFYITDGLFDRWNGIPLEQTLHKAGHKQFQCDFFTRDSTSKMYQTAKMLMFDERLSLYDWPIPDTGMRHSALIKELLSLQANQLSRNLVVVEAPKTPGAHDDASDAVVRAIWLSSERLTRVKYASHGAGLYVPTALTAPSVASYRVTRARRHGVAPERTTRRFFVR